MISREQTGDLNFRIFIKHGNFLRRKYIWKCRLHNVGHFVKAAMCFNQRFCNNSFVFFASTLHLWYCQGVILCMCPTNERRRYIVTSSLIGWAHTQNDPCCHFDVHTKYYSDRCDINQMTSDFHCNSSGFFFNSLLTHMPKKTWKHRITGLWWGESTGGFPHQVPVMWKTFPCHNGTINVQIKEVLIWKLHLIARNCARTLILNGSVITSPRKLRDVIINPCWNFRWYMLLKEASPWRPAVRARSVCRAAVNSVILPMICKMSKFACLIRACRSDWHYPGALPLRQVNVTHLKIGYLQMTTILTDVPHLPTAQCITLTS